MYRRPVRRESGSGWFLADVDFGQPPDGLLGDSAFGGSLGMGTSMAIVGAYVLAAAGGDHRTAFAAYQSEMRDYVAANQKRPPGGASGFVPRIRRGIWLRNQFMRLLPHLPGAAKMTGDMQRSANLITLKDYEVDLTPPLTGSP